MSWGDELERRRHNEYGWFKLTTFILTVVGLTMIFVNLACPRHPVNPPVNPTPDADASTPVPPPGQNPSCQSICKTLKQTCATGDVCLCDFVVDPLYSHCLLSATNRPANEVCAAATACDHGK